MAFISFKDLLIKNAARFRSRNEAVLLSISKVWDETSREFNFSDSTSPSIFKKGNLIIGCSSLAEASHFKLQKEKIRQKINQLLNKDLVKEIQFRVIHNNNLNPKP